MLDRIFSTAKRAVLWRTFAAIVVLVSVTGVIAGAPYYNRAADFLADKSRQKISLPRFDSPRWREFRLGLDLQGGTHLVYEADMNQVAERDRSEAIEGARDVIERRVNTFGVSEPLVQSSVSGDTYRIVVDLAGVKDVKEAIDIIGATPILDFREQSDQPVELPAEQQQAIDEENKKAEDKAEEVLAKAVSGGDFAALALDFSDDTDTKSSGGELSYVTESDSPMLANELKDIKPGQVKNKVLQSGNDFYIYKLLDKRTKKSAFDDTQNEKEVKASHILVCVQSDENPDCDNGLSEDQAKQKINDLKTKATPKNFAQLAKDNSDDKGSATNGGDIGWFSKGDMVQPFEDAVFPQAKGTVSFVVRSQFGYHLIYKQDEREVVEYKAARIVVRGASVPEQNNFVKTDLDGRYLKRASVTRDPNSGLPTISLEFDDEGSQKFEEVTARNIGKPVGIYLDGQVLSAPNVNEKITGGRAVISGNFSLTEARDLVKSLNAGALPVAIKIVSQQTVGATLGQASLNDSLRAGIFGLLLVAVFMIIVFRLPGLLSVLSLLAYTAIVLAIFKIFNVTLTLAGMAGVILSIGIAVDANVLIFSRLREELANGKPMDMALAAAFNRAWPSIRDGNASTLITCLILILFSTGMVRGFALTLLIGVLCSMFTAIAVTRNLLELIAGPWLENNKWLIGVPKEAFKIR